MNRDKVTWNFDDPWDVFFVEKNEEKQSDIIEKELKSKLLSFLKEELKVVIIGAPNIGKTTIAKNIEKIDYNHCNKNNVAPFSKSHLLSNSLGASALCNYGSTFVADKINFKISGDLIPIKIGNKNEKIIDKDKTVSLNVWDTAGYEQYEKKPPSILMNGSNVIIICFTIFEESSLDTAIHLANICKNDYKFKEHCVFMALGTKVDMLGLSIYDEKAYTQLLINSNIDANISHESFTKKLHELTFIIKELNKSNIATSKIYNYTNNDTNDQIGLTTSFCNNYNNFNPNVHLLKAISLFYEKRLGIHDEVTKLKKIKDDKNDATTCETIIKQPTLKYEISSLSDDFEEVPLTQNQRRLSQTSKRKREKSNNYNQSNGLIELNNSEKSDRKSKYIPIGDNNGRNTNDFSNNCCQQ